MFIPYESVSHIDQQMNESKDNQLSKKCRKRSVHLYMGLYAQNWPCRYVYLEVNMEMFAVLFIINIFGTEGSQ